MQSSEAVAGSSASILADAGATEKKIKEVEEEIKEVKTEIKEIKKQLEIEEDLEAPQSALPEDRPPVDRPFLQQRLLKLDALLTVLQERLLVQEKERLSQRQGGTGAGASTVADIDDIIERAVKRARAKDEEVSVSNFGSGHWGHLSSAAGLHMRPAIRLPSFGSKATPNTTFTWTGATESQQADRYMSHLMSIVPISNRTSSPLIWLEGGNKHKSLLNIVGQEHVLHYSSIKGNTDAAIITRASNDVMLPSTGLCILFELKKPENMGQAAVYQAACQVVLANMLSPDFKPVVVLTDLRDHWQLHWLNGPDLMSGICDDRNDALAIIAACVAQAEQATMTHSSLEAEAPIAAAAAATSRLPAALINRQPPPVFQALGEQPDASLADLSGDLPDDELRAAHMGALMQQLSQLPVFSNLAQSKPPPFPMYS